LFSKKKKKKEKEKPSRHGPSGVPTRVIVVTFASILTACTRMISLATYQSLLQHATGASLCHRMATSHVLIPTPTPTGRVHHVFAQLASRLVTVPASS
jgi:ABC-type uncharacterized transport system auxiliary subunit